MPAPEALIEYGLTTENSLVDEPNLLIQSLTITPSREKKEYKGGEGYVRGVQYRNPTISFQFRGYISTEAGLAIEHPGMEVTELANYESTLHGFDPSVGILIYEDPSRELGLEDATQLSFSVLHYPFITA